MEYKVHILRFRAVNRDIFNAIKIGQKKVETRAGSTKYQSIIKGDRILFICGKSKFRKNVYALKKFRSIKAMLKQYKPKDVDPRCNTAVELEKVYHSFPGYKQKLRKYGLIVMELKK